jgi:hypothetical protein
MLLRFACHYGSAASPLFPLGRMRLPVAESLRDSCLIIWNSVDMLEIGYRDASTMGWGGCPLIARDLNLSSWQLLSTSKHSSERKK